MYASFLDMITGLFGAFFILFVIAASLPVADAVSQQKADLLFVDIIGEGRDVVQLNLNLGKPGISECWWHKESECGALSFESSFNSQQGSIVISVDKDNLDAQEILGIAIADWSTALHTNPELRNEGLNVRISTITSNSGQIFNLQPLDVKTFRIKDFF